MKENSSENKRRGKIPRRPLAGVWGISPENEVKMRAISRPSDVNIIYHLGNMMFDAGELDRAEDYFKKAQELHPDPFFAARLEAIQRLRSKNHLPGNRSERIRPDGQNHAKIHFVNEEPELWRPEIQIDASRRRASQKHFSSLLYQGSVVHLGSDKKVGTRNREGVRGYL
jgi:tetratricopeptide (TPR) repeat protein